MIYEKIIKKQIQNYIWNLYLKLIFFSFKNSVGKFFLKSHTNLNLDLLKNY